jgi:hypothetical protein
MFEKAEKTYDKNHVNKEKEIQTEVFKANGFKNTSIKKAQEERTRDSPGIEEEWPIVTLPYIKGTTKKIARILKKQRVNTVFKLH